MDAFFKYFYQDIGLIFESLINIVSAIFNAINTLFNFPMRMKIIKSYSSDLNVGGWIMVVISNLLILIIGLIIAYLIFRLIKRLATFRAPATENEKLRAENAKLQREILKMGYEKDKILAMKMTDHGIEPMEEMLPGMNMEGVGEEGENGENGVVMEENNVNRNTVDGPMINPDDSRFYRLTSVDNYYKSIYQPPTYDNDITLPEFCDRFRNFAASRLGLYYDIETIWWFVSALASCRLVILQGISGTGKTSLPYGFGKYLQLDSTIAAVQPSWRERTELLGYYNDFTKKFTETDFLRALYEANYFEEPHLVVLDEMNIARVEYYFAEMLSILEMPRPEEWVVDIVSTVWDNDPCLIKGGKIHISPNTWFVGTINNDDSTFAVADKVYDRAIPIDLDKKAPIFDAPDTEPVYITAAHLEELFAQAREMYPVSESLMKKVADMDQYLIAHFRLAFGNRIMKQIRLFVPVYVACGGKEIDALDFMIAKKVLRKFESLNLGFIKDEIGKYIKYLDRVFGKENFQICKEYLRRMEKMN